MKHPVEWILASGSPRRHELLARIHPHFRVVVSDAEEWEPDEADPVHQVEENALRKGRAVAAAHPRALVLAADTTVALGKRLFAKPADRAEAIAMLSALSGRSHSVLTGMALFLDGRRHVFHERSEVRFRPLDRAAIESYVDTVHVLDKAGAYAVQEGGERIVAGFEGSFENIMGLPVQRLRRELVQLGWVEMPAIPR
jgi:septum formation protein